MFIGEYKASLDGKSRVIIPAKLRDELGSRFIMTKGLDPCLTIYTQESWEAFSQKLAELPSASNEARIYSRYFAAGATECELDSQGRVTVPQHLREYAGLERELIVNGMLTKIEIWSRDQYLASESNNLSLDAIAEKMAELGI
ncbi:MAG TPA: division/cell wall cluster transcriptional repressor MraZ [Clostridiales bacterium]|jgi:MraZ protein|nr:division/cell wall cluster transcriptional repressor MraZ [Clostridiales bacterium]